MQEDSRPVWRFIDSGAGDAPLNMALDEALMRSVAERLSPPVLRVYRWSSPAVSLGYGQRAERELDLGRCREAGVQVVRRITGGRAVYHSDELTYSFSGPEDTEFLGRTVAGTYRLISQAIICALRRLGLHPESAPAHPGEGRASRPGAANPCFSSASRFEITLGGRKLVGSAQRRAGGAFLQQGSLLLRNRQSSLLDLIQAGASPDLCERLETVLSGQVTGLEEASGRRIGYGEAAEALRLGFEEAFGCSLAPGAPTESETALAERLARERYSTLDQIPRPAAESGPARA
jgi:lipoyl(octanoyl) transferase